MSLKIISGLKAFWSEMFGRTEVERLSDELAEAHHTIRNMESDRREIAIILMDRNASIRKADHELHSLREQLSRIAKQARQPKPRLP